MADLLSIAPLTETIEVRGAKVSVSGVTARGIADLLFRFPDLRKMWGTGQWDLAALLAMSDDILAAVIAAGCRQIDEENAGNLALDEKAELLGAIVRVTMPRGPGPFVEAVTGLMGSVGGGRSPVAPGTKSQRQSKR